MSNHSDGKMGFSRRTLVPIVIAAFAATIAVTACDGREEAMPALTSPSTPVLIATAAPTATTTSPAVPTVPPTLESNLSSAALALGIPSCSGGEQPPYVRVTDANGKILWERLLGIGIENYFRKVTGGQVGPSADKFQCIDFLIDVKYGQIISYGQDSGGFFPSKVAIFDAKSGNEVQRLWHPGHIKGVQPFYGVNVSGGTKDVLVVAALSNIGELTRNGPYVPVVFVVDRANMQVLTYEVVSPTGQALELRTERVNDIPTVSFRIDRDSPGVRRTIPFENLFTHDAVARAQTYQTLFK